MSRQRTDDATQESRKPGSTCIVCGGDSGGKAICNDPRCAEELAQG